MTTIVAAVFNSSTLTLNQSINRGVATGHALVNTIKPGYPLLSFVVVVVKPLLGEPYTNQHSQQQICE